MQKETDQPQKDQQDVTKSPTQNKYLAKGGLLEVVRRGEVVKSCLTLDERVNLALKVGEECVTVNELRTLFEKKEIPICYDGFEPSGKMHIAQGILKAINVNRLTSAGCVFVFWVADWFALLNNKMGGDLRKIKRVGEYFILIWKAVGMNLTNVRFLWTSEEIERDSNNYWARVMDISKRNTISRMKRCGQIMGRSEGDDQPAAQILYPCMQCADIFYIGADICQLGIDQRKVNMLAREYVDSWNDDNKKEKLRKPIILSHSMLPGLMEGQEKMSKSQPDTAIFMEDSEEDVKRKIKKAYCPPGEVANNPVVKYIEMLVFPKSEEFHILRSPENGGDQIYKQVEDFLQDYADNKLHPADVKAALTIALNKMLAPVRELFQTDPEAKALLADLNRFKVTR